MNFLVFLIKPGDDMENFTRRSVPLFVVKFKRIIFVWLVIGPVFSLIYLVFVIFVLLGPANIDTIIISHLN